MIIKYKQDNPFENRKKSHTKMMDKYKHSIVAILYSSTGLKLPLRKILIKKNWQVFNLMMDLRRRLKIQQHQAIFMFFNNKLKKNNDYIQDIYNDEKDTDGGLYIDINLESTFGTGRY